jgi:hypothetical protein
MNRFAGVTQTASSIKPIPGGRRVLSINSPNAPSKSKTPRM